MARPNDSIPTMVQKAEPRVHSPVTFEIVKGSARIFVDQHNTPQDNSSWGNAVAVAVENCVKRQNEICVVCILAMGLQTQDCCKSPSMTEDNVSFSLESLEQLEQLAAPVVGIAVGSVKPMAIPFLGCCDMVMSTDAATFRLPDGVEVVASQAKEAGLVSCILDDTDSLFRRFEHLRDELSKKTRTELAVTKVSMREMWNTPFNHQARMEQNSLAQESSSNEVSEGSDKPRKARGHRAAKKKDFTSQYTSHEGPTTSLMICNIPCRVTQQQLVAVINSLGFTDTYDFLYLPAGGRSSATGSSNLGYGFVNFIEPEDASAFAATFTNFTFDDTSSTKVAKVRPAHIQGLANNIRHFGRSTTKHRLRAPLIRVADKNKDPRVSRVIPTPAQHQDDVPNSPVLQPNMLNIEEPYNSCFTGIDMDIFYSNRAVREKLIVEQVRKDWLLGPCEAMHTEVLHL